MDVEGDPLQQKGNKKAFGAEGYSPLGSFNPLYPNAQGGMEDEVKRAPKYDPDKFSARGVARDILFGSGPSNDNLARFDSVNDPRNALSSVSPSYSAVRRNELKNKLGVDATQSAIREDFMSRYRAVQDEAVQNAQASQKSATVRNVAKKADEPIDFKRDFNALKQQQIERFGEMYAKPEFEAEAHLEQQDEACLIAEPVKKEVVKPTKVMTHDDSVTSTLKKRKRL